MNPAVDKAAADMLVAAQAFDTAYRAGADAATLAPLRAAHNQARSVWHRARAASGDTQSAVVVAMGDA